MKNEWDTLVDHLGTKLKMNCEKFYMKTKNWFF